ncbi:hypothetical protein CPn_0267 [Chlamydia pneumoniae CWL029]|uniref:Uncharacterized protein n=3 Tax=Chlamydia pneumoniae TaxID=83558 RepID=Q9Z8S1_CHLPN|nr:hypothetical protein CPn_0267 [Chlamydia pneumoniae CWL029]AAF38323.1 hypothetical protein CP_0493 [Chlamydia pneumoniae AR39]BAA98477.1 hypothetical protein [Chlamydia pneumoniae J138]
MSIMSLNKTNALLNQPEPAVCLNAWDPKYINQDRKTFACTVTLLVIATLMILTTGVIVLLAMGSPGLSVLVSTIIGTSVTTLGTALFIIGLVKLIKKSLAWIQYQKYFQEVVKQKYEPFSIPKNDNVHKLTSCLPSPLDIESPSPEASTPVSKLRIACSGVAIVLGVTLLIGAVVSVFFCTGYLQLALCVGFACLGTALFVGGLAGLRTHSLIAQGIMYLYLTYYLSSALEERNETVKDQRNEINTYLTEECRQQKREKALLE